jgi:NlpC/P60 family putative phage cell wall peptidase
VVAEAMTWLGTPFRDQANVKGKNGAVDCAMLLVSVFTTCGLVAPFDPRPYAPQWHLHRSDERFLEIVSRFGREVENPASLPAEALAKAGDVIVWRVARCFSHGGIIADNNRVIHAYYKTGQVTISSLNEAELACLPDGRARPYKLFDLWAAWQRRTHAEAQRHREKS